VTAGLFEFSLRMAWREARGATRHLVIFFTCIALGVAALVGVGSFAQSLDRTLAREAKALMGGDLEVRSTRPLEPRVEALVEGLRDRGATITRVRELVGMAREPGSGATLLVELKVVEAGYPLYGRLEVRPDRPLAELLGESGALVHESVLTRLRLGVGDPLLIGSGRFTITGVIQREPDRSVGLFSLGPRVVIAAEALERTALVQVGSRIRYGALVRLPDGLEAGATRAALARQVPDPAVRITAYHEARPGLRRFFDQVTTYLGLVGLVSLLVGGIGVAATVRTFMLRARFTIAVLKCLGATSRILLATYLGQALALGAAGSLAGVALGSAVQALLAPLLAGYVPFEVEVSLAPGVMARGLGIGLLTALLCAVWPILEIRSIPPALILRAAVAERSRARRRPWLVAAGIALGLVGLAFGQAGSLKLGSIFVLASVAALIGLAGMARAVTAAARRLPRLPWLAWRQGLAGLRRPGGQTTGVVVALGVGVMLIVTVALLERSMDRHIDLERRREVPSFFFVDIQRDQADGFVRTVSGVNGDRPVLVPVVRSRLAAINGRPIDRTRADGHEKAWLFSREYVLTIADEVPAANVVTRGRWWTPVEAAARPRVSVEDEAARTLGVDVGGTLTFDIHGVRIETEVMSLRKVDWQSLNANFFMIVSPGALDGAPLSYIATARVPPSAELAVQDAVVQAFPNVTAIPVRDVLERVGRVVDQIGVAVRVVALFVIAAGLVVMASALAASRYQRLYESVLLRTLGASRATVARAFAVEYGCLGGAAGVGGTLLAAVLAWVVLRFLLDVPWTFEPATLLLGVAVPVGLALAVGFLATYRLLGHKPLPVLRQQ
jgi:putative ABC transport system permease protein